MFSYLPFGLTSATEKPKPRAVVMGKLTLVVQTGVNLKDMDLVGKMDPYVVLKCGLDVRTGDVMTDAGTNPVFNQTFTFDLRGFEENVSIECLDQDLGFSDTIGTIDIPVATLIARSGAAAATAYPIFSAKKERTGELMIRCQSFDEIKNGTPAPAPVPAATAAVSPAVIAPASNGVEVKTPAPTVAAPAAVTAPATVPADTTNHEPVKEPSTPFEIQCKRAADAIRSASALLFSPGAGFSAESGIPTCAEVSEYKAYRLKKLEYSKLVSPFWMDDDIDLYYGFWGKALNDARNATPHQGHALIKKWRDRYFSHTNATSENIRSAVTASVAASIAAAAAVAAVAKSNALTPTSNTPGGNRASKRASRGITMMDNAAELFAKHKAGIAGAPPSPSNAAAAAKYAAGASPAKSVPENGAASPPRIVVHASADHMTPRNAESKAAVPLTPKSALTASEFDIHNSKHNTPLGSFFWYTTNTDAQWLVAGFSPKETFESHGNVERWQCHKPTKCKAAIGGTGPIQIIPPAEYRFTINPDTLKAEEKPARTAAAGADSFIESFYTNRPACRCGAPARPWVFQNGSDWVGNSDRSRVFRAWLEAVRKWLDSNPNSTFVILEAGAGTRVTTLRYESHDLLNALPVGRVFLIRVNQNDAEVPDSMIRAELKPFVISIANSALATVRQIDRYLEAASAAVIV